VYSARIRCVKEIYCSLRSSNLHIHFLPFHQENARDDIASLKKELAAIRQLHDAGSVDSALPLLRQYYCWCLPICPRLAVIKYNPISISVSKFFL